MDSVYGLGFEDWQDECFEWLEVFFDVLCVYGFDGVCEIFCGLDEKVVVFGVDLVVELLNMFYKNMILVVDQFVYLGDVDFEECIENVICWNVMVMVFQVNDNGFGVGGYIVIYVLVVMMFEVGFNYFFCGCSEGYGGDLVNVQVYVLLGVYVCVFFEGCILFEEMQNFCCELQFVGGLLFYLYLCCMFGFWQMLMVLMGLLIVSLIY